MIYGDLKHRENYKNQMPSFLYDCLEALDQAGLASKEDGSYEIMGCRVSLETNPSELPEQRKLEGHKKYIDIQYEVNGEEEWIGVETKFDAGREFEAHPDRDLYFYEDAWEKESKLRLTTGRFAIFFPEDLHRPLCQGKKGSLLLRKAVMKVPVSLISNK